MDIYLSGTICSIFPTLTNFPSSGGSMIEILGGFALENVLQASDEVPILSFSGYRGTTPN